MHVEGGRGPPFGTPKMTKMIPFWPFWGYQKWHFECPNQNSKTTFQYKVRDLSALWGQPARFARRLENTGPQKETLADFQMLSTVANPAWL